MKLKQMNEQLKRILNEFYDVEPDTAIEMEIVSFGKAKNNLERFELDGIEFYKADDEDLQNAVDVCIEEEFFPHWQENNQVFSYNVDSIDYNEEDGTGIAYVGLFSEE